MRSIAVLLFSLLAAPEDASNGMLHAAPAARSAEAPSDALADFRALASALRKQGPGKDTAVVLEYRLDRQTNLCAGGMAESSVRLRGDGRLESLVTRSFSESERNGPGSFQGKLGKAGWDSLFARLEKMKWVESGMLLPPPGMSETIYKLRLSRNGKEASYALAGSIPPNQSLIEDGLDAASDLAPRAQADTLWALSLEGESPKAGKSAWSVRAVIRLRGRLPLRLGAPVKAPAPACGSFEWLSWIPPKEEKGVTPLPPEIQGAHLAKAPAAGPWTDLQPGATAPMDLAFTPPKGKPAPREGRLVLFGLAVARAGTTDTLAPITLYSPIFRF